VHLRQKKATLTIKPKETKMIITKLHLGVALFASAYLYYSNQPLVQQRTTFYFEKSTTNAFTKSMDDGKEVYADFLHTMPSGKRKGDGINFPTLDGSIGLPKKNPKYSRIKFRELVYCGG
jgi:hypothetical protein